nr:MAG TPA: ASCH domain protein [Caudoviricetes sp.]
MKRISFKDSGGLNLTQSVLSGRKTMTRRIVIEQVEIDAMVRSSLCSTIDLMRREKIAYILKHSPYKVGDVVAIQQAYKDIPTIIVNSSYDYHVLSKSAGWTNKMFVKAELMPHHIRITDVKVERLQDISDEDCLREGVIVDDVPFVEDNFHIIPTRYIKHSRGNYWVTPRAAFAALIDKVSGRGTWNSNPLVWCYSFELED